MMIEFDTFRDRGTVEPIKQIVTRIDLRRFSHETAAVCITGVLKQLNQSLQAELPTL